MFPIKYIILGKIWGKLTNKAALDIYKTMTLPLIDYGDIFYNMAHQYLLSKLKVLQKRALRIIAGLSSKSRELNCIEMYQATCRSWIPTHCIRSNDNQCVTNVREGMAKWPTYKVDKSCTNQRKRKEKIRKTKKNKKRRNDDIILLDLLIQNLCKLCYCKSPDVLDMHRSVHQSCYGRKRFSSNTIVNDMLL